ncbi:MAG TPA: M23 family metallopeptidase [Dermatophilaceae bacterium]|nr:M23 family metallopeptidase [Dermatophilaceae bacterium]
MGVRGTSGDPLHLDWAVGPANLDTGQRVDRSSRATTPDPLPAPARGAVAVLAGMTESSLGDLDSLVDLSTSPVIGLTPGVLLTSGFVKPIDHWILTSPFGLRLHPISHVWKLHSGTDLAAACGTPVRAVKDGTVTAAGLFPSYGNRVVIDHGSGLVTTYNHLQSYAAAPGLVVRQGQIIGYVGTTGNSTGCHLHFEVRVNEAFVDAGPFLDLAPAPRVVLPPAVLPSTAAAAPATSAAPDPARPGTPTTSTPTGASSSSAPASSVASTSPSSPVTTSAPVAPTSATPSATSVPATAATTCPPTTGPSVTAGSPSPTGAPTSEPTATQVDPCATTAPSMTEPTTAPSTTTASPSSAPATTAAPAAAWTSRTASATTAVSGAARSATATAASEAPTTSLAATAPSGSATSAGAGG